MNSLQALQTNDYDPARIRVPVRRRSARQSRIGGLGDDAHISCDARGDHTPLFDQGARPGNGQHLAPAFAVSEAIRPGCAIADQDVPPSHYPTERVDDAAHVVEPGHRRFGRE